MENACFEKLSNRIFFVLAVACFLILPSHSGCGQKANQALVKVERESLQPVIERDLRTDLKPAVSKAIKPVASQATEKKTPETVNNCERVYNDIIVRAAERHQIDPAIIRAIIMAESGYDSSAVSERGAMGLMQLMPETAEAMGVENGFDPENNINGGVKYFRQLLDRFDGEIELALAAYQAGSGKVIKYNGVPPFRSTKHYIRKVFRFFEHYKTMRGHEIDRA